VKPKGWHGVAVGLPKNKPGIVFDARLGSQITQRKNYDYFAYSSGGMMTFCPMKT
jgi:hypothetical protein